jgi:hypothetical protein
MGGTPGSGWAAMRPVLVGLVWFQAWTIRHRHDDD